MFYIIDCHLTHVNPPSYGDSVISTTAKNSVPQTNTSITLAVTVINKYIRAQYICSKTYFTINFCASEMSPLRRRSVSHSFKIVAADHALINLTMLYKPAKSTGLPSRLLVYPVDYWLFYPHLLIHWVVEHLYWF